MGEETLWWSEGTDLESWVSWLFWIIIIGVGLAQGAWNTAQVIQKYIRAESSDINK